MKPRWPIPRWHTRRALGLVVDEDILTLVEAAHTPAQAPACVRCWQQRVSDVTQWPVGDVCVSLPLAAEMRQACVRASVRARRAGVAVPEQMLVRTRMALAAGLSAADRVFQIEAELSQRLPWPLDAVLWDCRPVSASGEEDLTQLEVVALPKDWVVVHQRWCQEAGLRLVLCEPHTQALARAAAPDAGDALATASETLAWGLALGVLRT